MAQKPGTGITFVRLFLMNCILKALQNGSVDSFDSCSSLGEEMCSVPDPPCQRKLSACLDV